MRQQAALAAAPGDLAQVLARRWLLRASHASVAVALLLIVTKTIAWFVTDSASLLGSLLDSIMDSMASMISMLAVRYSLKPADDQHRFGHGKAESLAALAQAGFILASALLLAVWCIRRALLPEAPALEQPLAGVIVSVFAIVCTLGLVAVQNHAIRLTGSAAIRADRMHYGSDLLLNLGVIVAMLAAAYGYARLDTLFGLAIALFIGRGAWRIGWQAFDALMDRELPPEIDREIMDLAMRHAGVLGVHDLRTRGSGMCYHIQLHLEFADSTTLLAAHRIADEVELALLGRFPGADVIIHQDPQSMVELEYRRADPAP